MDRIVPMLDWVEHSALAVAIAQSSWVFPAIETTHVIVLTLTVGTILIVDLRLLGLASVRESYTAVQRHVLPWTWAAFAAAVVSGSLLFITQATEYAANAAFRAKFVLLALAGVNMLVFELVLARGAATWGRAAPWPGKVAALLSIMLWASIVFFGRRVGFTMGPGQD